MEEENRRLKRALEEREELRSRRESQGERGDPDFQRGGFRPQGQDEGSFFYNERGQSQGFTSVGGHEEYRRYSQMPPPRTDQEPRQGTRTGYQPFAQGHHTRHGSQEHSMYSGLSPPVVNRDLNEVFERDPIAQAVELWRRDLSGLRYKYDGTDWTKIRAVGPEIQMVTVETLDELQRREESATRFTTGYNRRREVSVSWETAFETALASNERGLRVTGLTAEEIRLWYLMPTSLFYSIAAVFFGKIQADSSVAKRIHAIQFAYNKEQPLKSFDELNSKVLGIVDYRSNQIILRDHPDKLWTALTKHFQSYPDVSNELEYMSAPSSLRDMMYTLRNILNDQEKLWNKIRQATSSAAMPPPQGPPMHLPGPAPQHHPYHQSHQPPYVQQQTPVETTASNAPTYSSSTGQSAPNNGSNAWQGEHHEFPSPSPGGGTNPLSPGDTNRPKKQTTYKYPICNGCGKHHNGICDYSGHPWYNTEQVPFEQSTVGRWLLHHYGVSRLDVAINTVPNAPKHQPRQGSQGFSPNRQYTPRPVAATYTVPPQTSAPPPTAASTSNTTYQSYTNPTATNPTATSYQAYTNTPAAATQAAPATTNSNPSNRRPNHYAPHSGGTTQQTPFVGDQQQQSRPPQSSSSNQRT